MTEDQKIICLNLGNVNCGTWSKFDRRFIAQVSDLAKTNPDADLSEKQIEWMFRLLFKYRKQNCQKHTRNIKTTRYVQEKKAKNLKKVIFASNF